MKKTMKKTAVRLMAAIIIVTMSGCAGGISSKGTSEPVEAAGKIESTETETETGAEAETEVETEPETETKAETEPETKTGTGIETEAEPETALEVGISGEDSIAGWTEAEDGQKYIGSDKIWEKYVDHVLVKKFGEFHSFHVEYGYGETENGFKPIPAGIDTGIISTHIEDMDSDGVPELMVFVASPSQEYGIERGIDINMHTYCVQEGRIMHAGETRLCSNIFLYDAGRFQIFIKEINGKKAIGASQGGQLYVGADGSTYEMNLYQIVSDEGTKNICNLLESASDWDDTIVSWGDVMRKQGFAVTADEWKDGKGSLYISPNEPDCRSLITGSYSLNMPIADFYSSAPNDGEEDIRKIIGDITIQN